MTDRTYEFVQLDVFTQRPLTGNPLAIFTDARGMALMSRVLDGQSEGLTRNDVRSLRN
jgi:hypothetical protein